MRSFAYVTYIAKPRLAPMWDYNIIDACVYTYVKIVLHCALIPTLKLYLHFIKKYYDQNATLTKIWSKFNAKGVKSFFIFFIFIFRLSLQNTLFCTHNNYVLYQLLLLLVCYVPEYLFFANFCRIEAYVPMVPFII